jgi:hypothetical protein
MCLLWTLAHDEFATPPLTVGHKRQAHIQPVYEVFLLILGEKLDFHVTDGLHVHRIAELLRIQMIALSCDFNRSSR